MGPTKAPALAHGRNQSSGAGILPDLIPASSRFQMIMRNENKTGERGRQLLVDQAQEAGIRSSSQTGRGVPCSDRGRGSPLPEPIQVKELRERRRMHLSHAFWFCAAACCTSFWASVPGCLVSARAPRRDGSPPVRPASPG